MNIFKKIGSFATTSWKDFSELYADQQQQQQQPMLEVSRQESDSGNDSMNNSANDQAKKEVDDGSFELRKRPEKEIVAKKNGHGFFRRHFSKKKLQVHLLDDPRSPTTAFARTPIQAIDIVEQADILSPFNVQDMLSTVQSAVDLQLPGTPTTKSSLAFDNGSYVGGGALSVPAVPPASELLEDHDFTGNVGDWNDFQFDRNDKVMTESLIVELSTLDINKEETTNSDDNSSTTVTSQTSENEAAESCDEPTQFLLQVDKVQEVIEKAEAADDDESGQKFKIVGCVVKAGGENTAEKATAETTVPIASTPKKKSATSKLASEEQQPKPRTPLQAICNSPMVNSNKGSVLTGGGGKKKAAGTGKQQPLENAKKKKINSGCSRQLPKAPATPLTPLFKDNNNKDSVKAPKVVSHFDKENF